MKRKQNFTHEFHQILQKVKNSLSAVNSGVGFFCLRALRDRRLSRSFRSQKVSNSAYQNGTFRVGWGGSTPLSHQVKSTPSTSLYREKELFILLFVSIYQHRKKSNIKPVLSLRVSKRPRIPFFF